MMGEKDTDRKRMMDGEGQERMELMDEKGSDCEQMMVGKDMNDEQWLMNNDHDEQLMNENDMDIERLVDVFQAFDEMIEVNVPSKEQFKAAIVQHQAKQRKGLLKELVLFIFTACIVLTTLMTVFIELPTIFFVVQFLLLCFLPFMFKLDRHHEEEELYS